MTMKDLYMNSPAAEYKKAKEENEELYLMPDEVSCSPEFSEGCISGTDE